MFYLNSFCSNIKNFPKTFLVSGCFVSNGTVYQTITAKLIDLSSFSHFYARIPQPATRRGFKGSQNFIPCHSWFRPTHPLMSTFATALCRNVFFYYWQHQTKRKAGTKQNAQKQITHQNVLSQHLYQRLRCPGPCELRPYLLWCLYLFLLMQANEGDRAERSSKKWKLIKKIINMRTRVWPKPPRLAQVRRKHPPKAIPERNKLNSSNNFHVS